VSSNAYAEARAIARKEAEKATCFVKLGVLQALLAEIDQLCSELSRMENELAPHRQDVRDEEERVFSVVREKHGK
jgi:hypothetical protein